MSRIRERLSQLTPDARVAVVLVIMLAPLIVLASEDDPPAGDVSRGIDGISVSLLVLGVLCLLARKRFPGTVVVAVMTLIAIWYRLGHTSGLINPIALVAFYQLGTTGDRRRQLGIGVPATFFPVMFTIFFSGDSPWDKLTSGDVPADAFAWPLAALLLGELVRNRRLLLDEYAERARIAEAERDAEADRRVAQERLRIARDLHDVLAHTVSVMNVQAGVAVDTIERDPAVAKAAMDSIRVAGKEAMNEVRATVSVLRDTDATTAVVTQPAPGIDRIGELVEATRTRGRDVELSLDLDPGGEDSPESGIDSLVGLTAYRVVQEGLTNVTRHSQATHVDVRLHLHRSELVVEVSDNGTPSMVDKVDGGFGMKGMRERIEPLGGTLSYGPRPQGGWTVLATLPTTTAR